MMIEDTTPDQIIITLLSNKKSIIVRKDARECTQTTLVAPADSSKKLLDGEIAVLVMVKYVGRVRKLEGLV